MANTHVLSGLLDKRSELMGIIEQRQKEINILKQQISSLDGSIRIFDENFDLSSVKPKRVMEKSRYFSHGECNKLILDIIRLHPEGLSFKDIIDSIISSKNLSDNDNISKPVSAALHYLFKNQKLSKEKDIYKIAY
ncbi:hypothetical protein I2492_09980 [Budviciaceae bacterium CWB-B4]|uniref:HTH HARE-type domain-containing protein n=1 Tax=Limnobaculum xujianqingii TaxID=2738837 RepID=A0A9D7AIA4_9GAMM|nr:hypothetical protein [Limnobaculum xujianqingii]MBK5073618.1 hypothetical protein [Limnobaculum xujianqingii]MBK5176651.1 hypothetical protein [Limnobaculum xujianqingii]